MFHPKEHVALTFVSSPTVSLLDISSQLYIANTADLEETEMPGNRLVRFLLHFPQDFSLKIAFGNKQPTYFTVKKENNNLYLAQIYKLDFLCVLLMHQYGTTRCNKTTGDD